jgi:hypothetical protein
LNALRRTSRTARTASLLSLGALTVHELRYVLAYGDRAGEALASQGHAYLSDLGGALVTLMLATLLATVLAGALAPRARRPGQAGSAFRRMAVLYGLALVAIFCAQELAEGAVASGHPAGLAAVLAHGGWVALPLALAAGAVCSLACLALQGVERALARRTIRRARRRPPPLAEPHPAPAWLPLVALNLAFGFARRPPPLLSVG